MKKILLVLCLFLTLSLTACGKTEIEINKIYTETVEDKEVSISQAYNKASKSSCYIESNSDRASGVVIKETVLGHYILTYYTIGEVNDSVSVVTEENTYSGRIVSLDASNLLALVLVTNKTFDLEPVTINDKSISKGEDAIVVSQVNGSSNLNYLNRGYISYFTEYLISTDAPTNHMSLGSGIFDLNGNLLGIICQEETGVIGESSSLYLGVCYAVRGNLLTTIVNQMIKESTVERPLLGITVSWYNNEYRYGDQLFYDLPDDAAHEVVIKLVSNSNGDKAGIQVGDVIMSVNGIELTSRHVMTAIMRTSVTGDILELSIKRYNESTDSFNDIIVNVTLNN